MLTLPRGFVYSETRQQLSYADEYSDVDRVPAYHGYSFSGNATGQFVYVGVFLAA